MSATEQNYQGLEGRNQNHQPDDAPGGRKPRQDKFGSRAKSGIGRHQEGKRHDHVSHDETRDQSRASRGRHGESFNRKGRRPGGEDFGGGEQRDHGEHGPRQSREKHGFSRDDHRDHRDEAASFERTRSRDARETDEHARSSEARSDKRFGGKGDFSRSAEGDGGKRDRFARDRHDKPARGDWHGRNERDERADERRGSREGRTSLQPRARRAGHERGRSPREFFPRAAPFACEELFVCALCICAPAAIGGGQTRRGAKRFRREVRARP